ncbi:hypothetical protein F2Q70_00020911 [Brassica cretica]|uniref:Uncharacterized protein n=1 Tax=Brassica cretica TaxID=69181 RepID=A0A8S9GHZ2_BRACR|nr:hypothetical protein F2Q70_00020911 [Brassica cretica]KAF2597160.1 hypothetical protein F2Q68_00009815 [Brassica cretica]
MATVLEVEEAGLITRTVDDVEEDEHDLKKLSRSFPGLTFSVMLAHLPRDTISLVPRLTTEVNELKRRLATVEDHVRQMKLRPYTNTNPFQDVQYESLESVYRLKPFVPRRESPWKIDSEATGVSAKLRDQAKRYQALAGKIDDLCTRMQSSDPCDATLGPEFRTQRQTEFLLECFRLQQRASETGQKLVTLQTDFTRSNQEDQLNQAKMNTRRSLDLIKNNLKEFQRNHEIWMARIIGDLEGIPARDCASRVREFYIAR